MNQVPHKKAPIASALRILIVDTNRDSAVSLSMLVSKQGYLAYTVFSIGAAIKAAAEFHPKVVLLDIDIPGLNGVDVCHDIREAAGKDSIILIAITSGKDQSARTGELISCCDHHFTKPNVAELLIEILNGAQQHLDRKEEQT